MISENIKLFYRFQFGSYIWAYSFLALIESKLSQMARVSVHCELGSAPDYPDYSKDKRVQLKDGWMEYSST